MKSLTTAISLAALWTLSACGGGSEGEPTVDSDAQVVATALAALEIDAATAAAGSNRRYAQAASDPVGTGILPPALIAYCRQHEDWRDCGDKTTFTTEVNGQTRSYIVWRPKTAALRIKVPVVFMFHGTSGDGELFWDISAWREKALREGFLAVYPSALKHCYSQDNDHDPATPPEINLFTKWADGQLGSSERPLCGPQQIAALSATQRQGLSLKLADDIGFARALVAELRLNFPHTDPKRLFVTGFSNGAAMVGRLAAQMADVFAAARCGSSAVATQGASQTAASRPIPLMHSIGDEDEEQKGRFGFPNGSIPLTEWLMQDPLNPAYPNGVVLPFLAVLRRADRYTWSSGVVSGQQTSTFTYTTPLQPGGGAGHFSTTIIRGATHEYPNGRNHPVIMANELWPFFGRHPLP